VTHRGPCQPRTFCDSVCCGGPQSCVCCLGSVSDTWLRREIWDGGEDGRRAGPGSSPQVPAWRGQRGQGKLLSGALQSEHRTCARTEGHCSGRSRAQKWQQDQVMLSPRSSVGQRAFAGRADAGVEQAVRRVSGGRRQGWGEQGAELSLPWARSRCGQWDSRGSGFSDSPKDGLDESRSVQRWGHVLVAVLALNVLLINTLLWAGMADSGAECAAAGRGEGTRGGWESGLASAWRAASPQLLELGMSRGVSSPRGELGFSCTEWCPGSHL